METQFSLILKHSEDLYNWAWDEQTHLATLEHFVVDALSTNTKQLGLALSSLQKARAHMHEYNEKVNLLKSIHILKRKVEEIEDTGASSTTGRPRVAAVLECAAKADAGTRALLQRLEKGKFAEAEEAADADKDTGGTAHAWLAGGKAVGAEEAAEVDKDTGGTSVADWSY